MELKSYEYIFSLQKLFSFPVNVPFWTSFSKEVENFKKQCKKFNIIGEDLVILTEEPSENVVLKRTSRYKHKTLTFKLFFCVYLKYDITMHRFLILVLNESDANANTDPHENRRCIYFNA